MALIFGAEFSTQATRNLVRLRTLINLRWVAILGQISAIFVASWQFNLALELGLCSLVVGVSVVANIIAMFVYPENKRLSEQELTWWLVFDISQLAALLALTGGLNNPFALLILAPVTISAATLSPRSTILIGALGIAFATLVAIWNLPLRTDMGFVMRMPRDFVIGFWAALVIGVVFLGIYAQRVASEIASMGQALLATQMALSREQKLTDLAGVVAATAHELGTPLATIKLASSELATDLADMSELRQDAILISEQADRCRDILRSMGRAGKEDRHLAQAPLSAVVHEAAEPHLDRGANVKMQSQSEENEPEILRLPEIIHGVRNLVQNGVDFANSTVWIDMSWTATHVTLRITDDGAGYSPSILGRIGEPFMRDRRTGRNDANRPGYDGMGLGLFIAKTLLERTGATLTFANASEIRGSKAAQGQRTGALVKVVWSREALQPQGQSSRQALGENQPLGSQ